MTAFRLRYPSTTSKEKPWPSADDLEPSADDPLVTAPSMATTKSDRSPSVTLAGRIQKANWSPLNLQGNSHSANAVSSRMAMKCSSRDWSASVSRQTLKRQSLPVPPGRQVQCPNTQKSRYLGQSGSQGSQLTVVFTICKCGT